MIELPIQEQYRGDAWKVLATSIMLKRTRGSQVRRILTRFFSLYPTPMSFIDSKVDPRPIIDSLGLWQERLEHLAATAFYLVCKGSPKTREDVLKIYGVGDYVADAYAIFVLNDLTIEPEDYALKDYIESCRLTRFMP